MLALGTAAAVASACSRQATPALDASPDSAPPDPVPSDACVARAPIHPYAHGRAYTYVVEAVWSEGPNPDRPVTGFDLDGRYSDDSDSHGCSHGDYVSRYEDQANCAAVDSNRACTAPVGRCVPGPECRGGVDNSLADLEVRLGVASYRAPSEYLDDDIAHSQVVWLIRLANVDDEIEDPSVDVYLLNGYATFATDCARPIPSRQYAIDTASLVPGGSTGDDALFHAVGAIHNRRLYVATCGDARFDILGATSPIPWRLHAIHLAADVYPDRLENGAIGAWILGSDALEAALASWPQGGSLVEQQLSHLVDIELEGVCTDAIAHRYGAISLGYWFSAPVTSISPTTPTLDASLPGACGRH